MPGEVDGGLAGRVASPHDEDISAFHGRGFGPSRAVIHTRAAQRLQAWHIEAAPGDSGGDNDRPGLDLAAVRRMQKTAGTADPKAGHLLADEGRPEQPRLLDRAVGEVLAAEPAREAEVIADQGTGASLPTGHLR